jgi:hypothetical protein
MVTDDDTPTDEPIEKRPIRVERIRMRVVDHTRRIELAD